jgi:hypothetical protein
MNNKLLSLLHQRATTIAHTELPQRACVYCGKPVASRRSPRGATHSLDHFIPIRELEIARRRHPQLYLPNWLLPCCPTCNQIASGYVFLTFRQKFDFVKSRQHSKTNWKMDNNRRALELSELTVNSDFRSIIFPIDENLTARRIIYCPERGINDNLWVIIERMIPLCNSEMPFSAQ